MSNLLVQNIKHTNNTTAQTIDTSGRTTVSIMNNDSTYRSDGGAVTQNLVQSLAKAWVNFNGTSVDSNADLTGVRDSFNISSIVDNSTGDQTVTVSNAMGNDNYVFTALGGGTSASLSVRIENPNNRSTTTIDLLSFNTSSSQIDMLDVNCLFHGDLA